MGWKHTTKMMEMSVYMPWLVNRFLSLGGTREKLKIFSIQQFLEQTKRKCDVIAVCSGIGAKELLNDQSVYPMKGQIVKVRTNLRKFYTGEEVYSEPTYILPRTQVAVLGGSKKNEWNTDVDPKLTQDILKRCDELLPGISQFPIVDISCCLRPCRENGLRLEVVEYSEFGNHSIPIIANYGHAGCGPTLSWGCSKKVIEFSNQFQLMNRSKL